MMYVENAEKIDYSRLTTDMMSHVVEVHITNTIVDYPYTEAMIDAIKEANTLR